MEAYGSAVSTKLPATNQKVCNVIAFRSPDLSGTTLLFKHSFISSVGDTTFGGGIWGPARYVVQSVAGQ